MLEPLDIPDGYFEYLFPKKEWECLHRAMQRVFAEETGDENNTEDEEELLLGN